jgi:c(7)-type cytochrome triheme protein
MTPIRKLLLGTLLAAGLGAGAALAADLPRLPQPVQLPQGDGSPGAVRFDHGTHVDASAPGCVGCHPGRFSILGRSQGAAAKGVLPVRKVTHDAMEAGASCGSCHGKEAFGFDDCTMCHAM